MNSISAPKVEYVTFEELLDKDGYLVYTNIGTSMLPLLRERRDIIEIRKKTTPRCKKYDVVLYKRGEKYILHRILRVLPDGYLIAGDHNTFVERDVTDDMILGVMTRVIRNGKTIYPDNPLYRLYVHLWCDWYPARMFLLRFIIGSDTSNDVILVVCLAIVAAVMVAKIIGCTLPIIAKLLRFDPALMAGPMITTMVDAISLLIYFSIANALI